MPKQKKNIAKKWPINKLKPHPRQAPVFGDLPDEELQLLIADIEKRGLRDPIHILPDGTIICGHQRVRAARHLDWTEIDAIVRYDLESAGAAAVEEEFIKDNFVRRQLSPLARARCIQRLMEIEEGRAPGMGYVIDREELQARIGAQMGLCPRSVRRHLLVMQTIIDIQKAYDRGEITLADAGKLAALPPFMQSDVAQRMAFGENPKALVREYQERSFPPRNGCHDHAEKIAEGVIHCMRDLTELGKRAASLTRPLPKKHMKALRQGKTVIDGMIGRSDRLSREVLTAMLTPPPGPEV